MYYNCCYDRTDNDNIRHCREHLRYLTLESWAYIYLLNVLVSNDAYDLLIRSEVLDVRIVTISFSVAAKRIRIKFPCMASFTKLLTD